MSNEDLKLRAQEKLVAAQVLLREAADLAREGQFYLSFPEYGEFVPSSIDDRDKLREEAITRLKRDGKWNGYDRVLGDPDFPHGKYVDRPRTPYDDLDEDEREDAIENLIGCILEESDISSDAREYAERDTWWAPSRC